MVKLQKLNNVRILKVPNKIKTSYTKFNVYQDRLGNIIYSPFSKDGKNPFKDPKFIKSHKFNGDRTGFVNID